MVPSKIIGGGVDAKSVSNGAGEQKQGSLRKIQNWFLKKFGYPPPIAMQHDLERFKLLPEPPEKRITITKMRRKVIYP